LTISKRGIQLLAVSMSVVTLLTSANALACGGDWYPEVPIDPRIRGVVEAEKTLARGSYIAAAGSVVRMIPQIKTLPAKSDLLVARAPARVGGGKRALEREVPAKVLGHWLGKTDVDQQKNLAWSVDTLRHELTRTRMPNFDLAR